VTVIAVPRGGVDVTIVMMLRRDSTAGADGSLLLHLGWEEYLRLEDPPRLRFEYDEGRLIVSPSGANAHDLCVQILIALLEAYEEETQDRFCLAFADHSFFMPPGRRDLRPDVGIITDTRKDRRVDRQTWIEGAPNIAVEVLSPSTEERDTHFKSARYFEEGTLEYWLLDPLRETAAFFARGESDWREADVGAGEYRTPLLPGFVLRPAALWSRLRRRLREGA
jgi:Uma2 family endonuclease